MPLIKPSPEEMRAFYSLYRKVALAYFVLVIAGILIACCDYGFHQAVMIQGLIAAAVCAPVVGIGFPAIYFIPRAD